MKRYLKLLLLAGLAAMFLTSCRSVKLNKETEKQTTELKAKDSIRLIETSKTTVTIDTVARIEGQKTEAAKPLEDVVDKGDTLVDESSRHKTKTYYDKKTNQIKTDTEIKDYDAPVKAIKTTEVSRDYKEGSEVDYRFDYEATRKDLERKISIINNIILIVAAALILVILFVVGRWVAKKLIKKS